MIGGCLKRDVEGYGEVEVLGLGDETAEVRQGAEFAVNLFVSAVCRTDGPGAAAVAGLGLGIVVGAFAEGASDGMDGRQIDHVEAHPGNIGKALFAIGKRAVGSGLR